MDDNFLACLDALDQWRDRIPGRRERQEAGQPAHDEEDR